MTEVLALLCGRVSRPVACFTFVSMAAVSFRDWNCILCNVVLCRDNSRENIAAKMGNSGMGRSTDYRGWHRSLGRSVGFFLSLEITRRVSGLVAQTF